MTPTSQRHLRSEFGFTLVELLVVLVIIAIMGTIVLGALSSLSNSTEFGNNLSTLTNILQTSRSYAMASNTYVFVGIQEVDAARKPSLVPQVAGNGCLAIAVVSSQDGTNPYAPLTAANASIILPLTRLNNIHVTPVALAIASKPAAFATAGTTTMLFAPPTATVTSFTWPLTGTAQYTFTGGNGTTSQVIMFNPQGSAQILDNNTTALTPDANFNWIEMDLQPSNGNTIHNAATYKNSAAILIDGVSGAITLYRS